MLCSYGCNQEAKYTLKNGKYCCSSYYTKCPTIVEKNRNGLKKAYSEKRRDTPANFSKEVKFKMGKTNRGKIYSNNEIFDIHTRVGSITFYILKTNILDYKCSICGIDEWNSQPIVLEIDHINGDKYDNRKENLRFLCPNCHSQTETFRNRLRNKSFEVNDDQIKNELLKNNNNIYLTILSCGLKVSTGNYAKVLFVSKKLSAQMETSEVELLKFGEPLTGDPEPSSDKKEKV